MPTCESCNRTVENGIEVKHWICEDCRVDRVKEEEWKKNQKDNK